MPTLSAEEFAHKYGNAGAQPVTLSADEFAKRYGGQTPQQQPDGPGPIRRFLQGAGIPTSINEMRSVAESLDPSVQIMRGNPMAVAGPVGLAVGNLVKGIGTGIGTQAGESIAAAQSGNYGDALIHAVGAGVPLVGPQLAEGNVAGALGTAAAIATPFAVQRALPAVANKLGASAINQYKSVVDPSGANPLGGEVAADMLGKGITMRDPRTAIANYGEARAKAADARLNQAIDNMPQELDAGQVAGKINQTKAALYNQNTGAPIDPNADQIAAKLDAYSANHVLGNSEAFLDPNGNIVFRMDPKVARTLKQHFDLKPYEKGSEAIDATAQKGVGDALRDTLNQNPNVKAENAAVGKALDIKNELAPNAAKDTLPTKDRVVKAAARTLIPEVIGAVVPPARPIAHAIAGMFGGSSIGSIVIDVMRSPAWKTTSAVTKARLASAIASGDLDAVSRLASGIATGNAGANE